MKPAFVLANGGDEDIACADLIEAILCHKMVDLAEITRRVRESVIGKMFDGQRSDLPPPRH